MQTTGQLRRQIEDGAFDTTFGWLYPGAPGKEARARYLQALEQFEAIYGADRGALLVSAPGRTEIGGNHTDHQHGMVLAAAVNLDIICVVSPNAENSIRIQSKGYPQDVVDLGDLSMRREEVNKAAAMIRGVAAWFSENGYQIGGLDAYTTSDVLSGSGLSSSAAFEVAVGNMLNLLYNDGAVDAARIAIAGKYAENKYFGKPSGLMDQMASSVGGFVKIDFADPDAPVVEPVPFDFAARGYHLCIVDTKGSHADLTPDYAAIPEEMRAVAGYFGKTCLREVDEALFYQSLPQVRRQTGDRSVLRAIHFFDDNNCVPKQAKALRDGDFPEFLRLIVASGNSSFTCLQNVFSCHSPQEQGVSLGLALSRRLLEQGGGAWRVHGGGFAGTMQAFVPDSLLAVYKAGMEAVFGEGACYVLSIRPVGGTAVTPELAADA